MAGRLNPSNWSPQEVGGIAQLGERKDTDPTKGQAVIETAR